MNISGFRTRVFSFALMVSVLIAPFAVYGVDIQDIDDEISRTQSEIEQRQREIEQSKQRQYLYLQEGLSIAEKLVALDQDIANLHAEVEEAGLRLDEIAAEVEAKAQEVEETELRYEKVSLSLYKISRANLIDLLLSSTNFSDLARQMGFRRYGISFVLDEVRSYQNQLRDVSALHNQLALEVDALNKNLEEMTGEIAMLEGQKAMFQQMAVSESSRQVSLSGEIANITDEQRQLIEQKMAATRESTTVGEYEGVKVELPSPPFSPAFAVASIGYPHRVGLSQYGAYGRSKAGQTYDQILSTYYNAQLVQNYPVPERIFVDSYCVAWDSEGKCTSFESKWMPFEDQYLKGIAEMPTSWGNFGGYEALKAQAVIARSYAINFTGGGVSPICATQKCQVYYHPKVTNPAAEKWHQAVADTRGQVLTSDGAVIAAYYASTAGGYTRLPTDFDVRWGGTRAFLKRVIDADGGGKAYDGPLYGDSPWYYKVWYASGDVHPWLTQGEIVDLMNSALLPDAYNSELLHPNSGGWSYEQVRNKLSELGISPLNTVSGVTVVNSNEGYTLTLVVTTDAGVREIDGRRFGTVYKLRSRGNLALWSSLYDIIVR